MNIKDKNWFTLIEIIIRVTIFSIFVLIWTTAFTNALSTIHYIKVFWEEQENMLYDNFMIDEIIWDTKEIYEFFQWTSTWYLFKIDREKYNFPFVTLDINEYNTDWNNYKNIWIKKTIPLNDVITNWTGIIYTVPWESDIRRISDNVSILSNTWILNNPTWLLYNWTDIFVSDTGNACIRKLSDINNCFIGEYRNPWNTNTTLISPTYLALTWNILFISDTYNNKIRKVDITNTWAIYDFIWNWKFWYSDLTSTWTDIELSLPTWLAIDWTGLYVSDTWNNRILKFDINTGSWEIFAWTSEAKTIWLWSDWISNSPDLISIDSPTKLQIVWGVLYFLESTSWVIKWINLSDNSTYDIFWSYENIAYFGDFEDDISNHWSYSIDAWFSSGKIVWESDWIIPFSWDKAFRLIWDNFNTWSFIYNFSWVTLEEAQWLDLSFYMKSLSWTFNISYGFTYNNDFIWNKYNTWIIEELWNKYYIKTDFTSSELINWFKIDVSSNSWTIENQEFLLDVLELKPNNLYITWNKTNKFENNFPYLWSFYINWPDSYVSSIIEWNNYKFSLNNLWLLEVQNYKFDWINSKNNLYLFDDYLWNTKLSNVYIDNVEYVNKNNSFLVLWLKIWFDTFNGYFLDKYIWINK